MPNRKVYFIDETPNITIKNGYVHIAQQDGGKPWMWPVAAFSRFIHLGRRTLDEWHAAEERRAAVVPIAKRRKKRAH